MQKNTRATIAKPTKNDKWKKQWYFTKPIENNKIKEAIFQMKNQKLPGIDGIPI